MDYESMRAHTIAAYCVWMNLWQEDASGNDHRYKVEDFTIIPITGYESGWYHVEVLSVNDGDEGGPAYLTVWFAPDWSKTQSMRNATHEVEPFAIVQEFDTNLQFIMEEGKLTNTPNKED